MQHNSDDMLDDLLASEGAAEDSDADGWIMSYADLMSLLLCFFVILYSLSDLADSEFQQIAEKISEGFQGEYEKRKSPMDHGIKGETEAIRAVEMISNMMDVNNRDKMLEIIERVYRERNDSDQVITKMKSILGLEKIASYDPVKSNFTLLYPSPKIFIATSLQLQSEAQSAFKELVAILNQSQPDSEIQITVMGSHRSQLSYQKALEPAIAKASVIAQSLVYFGFNSDQVKAEAKLRKPSARSATPSKNSPKEEIKLVITMRGS